MSAAWRRGRRSIEGKGEIRQRDLVKNALRMRPDRVILGECRGEEAFDMLQAMNTGHEGSMATVHANTPRDAISRLEQMIGMAGLPMTVASIRGQIAAAIRVIVQLSRLSDGKRRVMSIAEITGLEGDIIQMQEIYKFVRTGTAPDGTVQGHFQATGVRPRFLAELVAMGIKLPGHLISIRRSRCEPGAIDADVRHRSDLSGLAVRRGLGGADGRGGLSDVLLGGVLSQPDQPAADDVEGPHRPRKRADRIAARARADRRRRLPARSGRAQPADPAIGPHHRASTRLVVIVGVATVARLRPRP